MNHPIGSSQSPDYGRLWALERRARFTIDILYFLVRRVELAAVLLLPSVPGQQRLDQERPRDEHRVGPDDPRPTLLRLREVDSLPYEVWRLKSAVAGMRMRVRAGTHDGLDDVCEVVCSCDDDRALLGVVRADLV